MTPATALAVFDPRTDDPDSLGPCPAPLPICCQAAFMRATADATWEDDPAEADRLEGRAARLLLRYNLPTSRTHNPFACQENAR